MLCFRNICLTCFYNFSKYFNNFFDFIQKLRNIYAKNIAGLNEFQPISGFSCFFGSDRHFRNKILF